LRCVAPSYDQAGGNTVSLVSKGRRRLRRAESACLWSRSTCAWRVFDRERNGPPSSSWQQRDLRRSRCTAAPLWGIAVQPESFAIVATSSSAVRPNDDLVNGVHQPVALVAEGCGEQPIDAEPRSDLHRAIARQLDANPELLRDDPIDHPASTDANSEGGEDSIAHSCVRPVRFHVSTNRVE
jgi:hypothetical protein